MNAMLDVFSGPAWRHLTIALLHTLWQGPAVAVMLWLALRWIPARRFEVRYAAAFASFLGMIVIGMATWSVLDLDRRNDAANASIVSTLHSETHLQHRSATTESTQSVGESGFPRRSWEPEVKAWEPKTILRGANGLQWLTAFWLLGVALMAGRTAWNVARLRQIARGPEVVDPSILQWTDELRCLLRVTRPLRIVEAIDGVGPAVFGVVRPVLALPVSMMTGLPPEAIRAVLAHELAHLRRYDYWFNLVQMAIEAVLFFNPAVWWISRQIRIEREACCDAMAARVLDRPTAIAEALAAWAKHEAARVVAQKGQSHFCGDYVFSENDAQRAAKIGTVPSAQRR